MTYYYNKNKLHQFHQYEYSLQQTLLKWKAFGVATLPRRISVQFTREACVYEQTPIKVLLIFYNLRWVRFSAKWNTTVCFLPVCSTGGMCVYYVYNSGLLVYWRCAPSGNVNRLQFCSFKPPTTNKSNNYTTHTATKILLPANISSRATSNKNRKLFLLL